MNVSSQTPIFTASKTVIGTVAFFPGLTTTSSMCRVAGSLTSYVVPLFVATLLLFDASVATTVMLYVPGAHAAVIMPTYVSLAVSTSAMPPAVTLAMPDSSVAVTVTSIDPFGRVTTGSIATDVIFGGFISFADTISKDPLFTVYAISV